MFESYQQVAFINALLGGFAVTFLSVLLTSASRERVVSRIVAVTTLAACCFVLSALGSTFSAVAAARSGEIAPEILALRRPLSLLFLSGTALLFLALGLSGFVRSRRLGLFTAAVATAALAGGWMVMRPFIH